VSLTRPPYLILSPEAPAIPLVVSIPHTGTLLPEHTAARLATDRMREQPMTDWHLHRLYDFLPRMGVTVIHAIYSRFVVDLNRPPDGRPLYPGRFETGLVPLETFQGERVFSDPPGPDETPDLRKAFHSPFHDALRSLLEARIAEHGRVVLVDAHSVGSAASRLHGELSREIYLGDRDGQTCGHWLRSCLQTGFEVEGYSVSVNDPYKGGYITDHYGRTEGVESIQIEMCQRVYMDESDPSGGPEHPRFGVAALALQRVFTTLAARVS
jgi:N-formylglutamate deformylase